MTPLDVALFVAFPLATLWPSPPAEPIATFTVSVSVATEDGEPVVDDAWVDAQLDFADTMFGDLGVHFRRAKPSAPLDPRFAHLESRADRDGLAGSLEAHAINVFVVASLRDVDEPPRLRMGVHWRERAHPDHHFVILASGARSSTLAHELGHFFGNPHSPVEDNVMSYDRSGGPVFFDDPQVKRIRFLAREYLRTHELTPN
jgi:hypothetical protein